MNMSRSKMVSDRIEGAATDSETRRTGEDRGGWPSLQSEKIQVMKAMDKR